MSNLLNETIEKLNRYEKSVDDIRFIQVDDVFTDWESFCNATRYLMYDSGFGRQEILPSLYIVGDDWWLERDEYDGAEEWEFKTIPIKHGDFVNDKNILKKLIYMY